METMNTERTFRKKRLSNEQLISIHGKIPPQAIEMEEAVLGALMLDSNALTNTIEMLQRGFFYKEDHQHIFDAIRKLFEKGKQVDILTVTQQLISDGTLEKAGGAFYLSSLTSHVVSAAHIENHAHVLAEKFMQRELIRIATETLHDSYEPTTDVLDLLDRTEQRLLEVSDKNLHSDYHQIGELMDDAITRIETAQQNEDKTVGIPTGFTNLDRMTAGLQRGTLIIIAARPAMGKTAFALSILRNMAVDFQHPVAFFSLEMTAVELVMRLIASESDISGERLKKGEKLNSWEKEQLKAKVETLKNAPIYIDDTPQLSIFELRAKCRRLKQRFGIQAVFIDYLQLMHASGDMNRNGNREQEISTISRQLKALSKELDIPVVALSQLSRQVEARPDKRPQLSDLRESGAIEQDADIVSFIYRPEYYKIYEDEKGSTLGMADIIIAKHRAGSIGDIRLRFKNEVTRFENLNTGTLDNYGSALQANTNFDNSGNGAVIIPSKMNQSPQLPPPDDIGDLDFGNDEPPIS